MSISKPTYEELEKRLAVAEPIVEALRRHEVDAVVGEEKITFLLLREVGEELLKREAEFRAMFALPGIGMVQADTPSFRLTKVNPKFCEITGYSAEELLAQTYIGLTHPADRRGNMKVLAQVLRGKTDSWTIDKRYIRKDGRIISVRVHGTALRDATGRAVRILAMISDITASKQVAQTRVATSQRDVRTIRDITASKPATPEPRNRNPRATPATAKRTPQGRKKASP